MQDAKAAADAAAGQDKQPPKRPPKRQPLPAYLRREDHRHEPEDANCPQLDCGKPMQRIGEDVSERLDIIPAEFFVPRVRQVGRQVLPDPGAGAGRAAGHRQGPSPPPA